MSNPANIQIATHPPRVATTPTHQRGLGSSLSIALVGLKGHKVEVQADIGNGLPGMTLLGLPDASLNEARDRVRSAARNVGIPLSARRTVINLIPAGLPKKGPGFDVSILIAAMAADGHITSPASTAYIGELGLDGSLRPFTGTLPAVLQARELGIERIVVPAANDEEARLVPGIEVRSYNHVSDLLIDLGADARIIVNPGQQAGQADKRADHNSERVRLEPLSSVSSLAVPDMADVRGQATGRWALEVAAAGGHHLLLTGPPGAGKTMLAERLPGILPPLTDEEAMLTTSVHSLSGEHVSGLIKVPPFQAPHHTSSAAALVGGGSGIPRPGSASRAHGGVLFLDEAPEFQARTLDALREPLESGIITLHRSAGIASYPARFQLIMAANPCPCGKEGPACECAALTKRRYWARMSGPLLDRVDIRVNVPAARLSALLAHEAEESSSSIRKRVERARAAARERWLGVAPDGNKADGVRSGGTSVDSAQKEVYSGASATNASVPASVLRSQRFRLTGAAAQELMNISAHSGLTGRGLDRVLRISWTLADLAERQAPSPEDVAAAVHLRGTPEAFN
ncbi:MULTISPECIES: YifB family Mg chelatase-like AAA ATPase [Micrococcaceae]|uniref:YifB family Mg chelatase-like AAA ATPase n=1 Tax=Micrococcaceae TaxID=1268 RepID=UPI0009F31532|nr:MULTISPECIES: YifB family Mg chelatase-like AAA ATPase [Micrococcaceae]